MNWCLKLLVEADCSGLRWFKPRLREKADVAEHQDVTGTQEIL